jgi:hypothetical protein
MSAAACRFGKPLLAWLSFLYRWFRGCRSGDIHELCAHKKLRSYVRLVVNFS